MVVVKAAGERGLEFAFAKFAQAGAGALLVAGGSIFASQRQAIVALAARDALPAIYGNRDYVAAGGLISYSASVAGAYRQAGIYAGRIFSRAPSRPNCRSCSRPRSSWWSTSRQPRRSASTCHRLCSRAPTR